MHSLHHDVALVIIQFFLPCKSLQVRKKRFAPAFVQFITGCKTYDFLLQLTCHTFICSLPLLVVGVLPELPCTNLFMSVKS